MARKRNENSNGIIISNKTKLVILVLVVILLACSFLFKDYLEQNANRLLGYEPAPASLDNCDLEIHFIDVGQGDAIAIALPDGKKVLIDSGDSKSSVNLFNYLDKNFFRDEAKVFDYVILTHGDSDHSGNMVKIYNEYQVNYSYRPYEYAGEEYEGDNIKYGGVHDTVTYGKYIKAIYSEPNSTVEYSHAGEVISGASLKDASKTYSLTFLSPYDTNYSNVWNAYSPAILLSYNNKTALFTGDGTEEQINEIVSNELIRDITIYKVQHHGSSTDGSNSKAFLDILSPQYAVISVGEDNRYGHPKDEVLSNLISALDNLEQNLYRTDLNGSCIFAMSYVDGTLNILADVNNKPIYVEWYIIACAILILTLSILYGKKLLRK